ncbi:hypothetical protein BNJ_00464 [Kaumoebavirus]|uniref:hypothetical protein n=1 Tax=Kaumoebavirus TaxID=1859492 RepID=UPI0009C1C156|nr:hypothetical protein BNJ_00002 [Kaumoebavirus]YP_009352856.1 hypothetical protein BNJ_00464 [Kaumoebavirus]ARA71850.1 hypothetical protein BNJ_00002 [Kaumoebavirus]ARA72276.1 hypothetical protein BNJ_00464 [Kaumoebavirus]
MRYVRGMFKYVWCLAAPATRPKRDFFGGVRGILRRNYGCEDELREQKRGKALKNV